MMNNYSVYSKPSHKYLVFLDIDGVFTSSRVHTTYSGDYEMWCKFDSVAVDFMNWIHDTYPVQFVLMSTWKNYLKSDDMNIKHWVQSSFANAGFRGTLGSPWKTDPDNLVWMRTGANDRAHEIKDYLENFGPSVADFILFDDNRYRFDEILGIKRLVHTDHENGLLYKHMLNAKSIMGTWEKR